MVASQQPPKQSRQRTITNRERITVSCQCTCKESIKYLGGTLSADGKTDKELSRRIGLATADFKSLSKVWAHASISKGRKIQIYRACVQSVLMYGLTTVCLNVVEKRRLDGFHCRCLRKILRIPPSFYSRVPNSTVLSEAGLEKLSITLARRQLVYLGKVCRSPSNSPLRQSVFVGDGLDLRIDQIERARGRPRLNWPRSVMDQAVRLARSLNNLRGYMLDSKESKSAWERLVAQATL
eukprot:TRINITY_DN8187_c0_g2_i2.p1 TRINITY_DN8187_c0_g2~~TRINITY_DN8187_c0_g2_i2.p1  ORF type:complete len:238 (-),score=0.27 TRINITY_DN8187_c0_g2_i2:31-744(-)